MNSGVIDVTALLTHAKDGKRHDYNFGTVRGTYQILTCMRFLKHTTDDFLRDLGHSQLRLFSIFVFLTLYLELQDCTNK